MRAACNRDALPLFAASACLGGMVAEMVTFSFGNLK